MVTDLKLQLVSVIILMHLCLWGGSELESDLSCRRLIANGTASTATYTVAALYDTVLVLATELTH